MSDLVSGLLAYSRIRPPAAKPQPVSADSALEAAIHRLASAVEQSGMVVTRDPLPAVAAESSHLEQLFENLLGNAIKYRRGGVQPQVHFGCRHDDGQWIFSVRDNGIGIEPEYHEKIFQIFQRLHTRAKHPGAGIGLSICKRIVEQYGGRAVSGATCQSLEFGSERQAST
jgi:signal transduction histidine kinase